MVTLLLAALLALPSPRPSPTLPPGAGAMSGSFSPGAALQRAVEAWNAASLDDLEALLAEDVVLVLDARVVRGRDAVLDAMTVPLDQRLHVEATRVVNGAKADTAWATCRWTAGEGLDDTAEGTGVVVFQKIDGSWRAVLVNVVREARP